MSRIFVTNPLAGSVYQIDVAGLAQIIKGTSIVSLADSDRYIEFGLSENLMIRIERGEGEHIRSQQVSIFSTLNADEISSVRVQLINDDEASSLALLEQRLGNMRQVYAIAVLLLSGRQDELGAALLKEPDLDIEQVFLSEEDRLSLEAAGPGTVWAVLTTIGGKIKAAPQAALNILSLVYSEGRGMLLERVRADTAKAVAGARNAQIAADTAEDNRIIGLATALDKTTDPAGRAAIEKRLDSSTTKANPQLAPPEKIAGLLTGPSNQTS